MAIEFRIPKLSDLVERARRNFLGLLQQVSLLPGSDYDIQSRVMGFTLLPVYAQIQYAAQQIFPRNARGQYQIRHGVRLGLPRKDAAKADGLFLLTGLIGAVQPALTTLRAASGTEVITQSAATVAQAGWANKNVLFYDESRPDRFVATDTTGMAPLDVFEVGGFKYVVKDLPGGGAVQIYGRFKKAPNTFPAGDAVFPVPGVAVAVKAAIAGPDGNLEYSTEADVISAANFIDPTAEALEVTGGVNQESEDAWGLRMEDAEAERGGHGNRAMVLTEVMKIPGVDAAWVYETFRGPGTGDVVIQGIAGARHLSLVRRNEAQTQIAPRPPTDANPGIINVGGHDWLITDFTDLPVAIDLVLSGGPGYEPDWSGSLLTAAGCTTTRINTTADPRTLLVQKNRVAIAVGPRFIEVGEVDSVDATGFNLKADLPAAPGAGRLIDPASSLTEPVRDVINGLFGQLAPGDTNPPTRYPAPTTRGFDKLTLNIIHAYVRKVTGVSDVLIASPPSNVIPAPKQQCTVLSMRLRH